MVMGFTVPLYLLFGANLVTAVLLMLPRPLCKPAVFLVQFSRTQIGMSITGTTVAFLLMLLATPLYDLFQLHKTKQAGHHHPTSAGTGSETMATEQARGMTEATANLSAVLTVANIGLALVNRKLGITLAELDELEERTGSASKSIGPNEVFGAKKVE